MPPVLPLLCGFFTGGILLARLFGAPVSVLLAALFICGGLAGYFLIKRREYAAALTVPCLFVVLGMLAFGLAKEELNLPLSGYLGREVTLTGHVHSVDEAAGESSAFFMRVETAGEQGMAPDGVSALVRVRVNRPGGYVPVYGQRISISGLLVQPHGIRNAGGFDYASYLAAAGVSATISVLGSDILILPGTGGSRVFSLIESARHKVLYGLSLHLPPTAASLAAGLLLGARERLHPEIAASYRILGISHLLAVSGLHAGFAAAFALFLAARMRRPAAGAVLAALLIVGYALLTGGRPPVWRAAVMLGMSLAARQYGRETDMLQGLGAAGLILLAWRPHWLFSLSFQLSFLAVLGIALMAPRMMSAFSRLPRLLAGPLAVTISAQLAVLPLQVAHFGILPILAVPANLICVPLVGLFMFFGLAGMAAGMLHPVLSAPFYLAALPVLKVLQYLPAKLAAIPSAAVNVTPPPGAFWLVYAVLILLFLYGSRICRTPARYVIAVLLLLNILCWGSLPVSARPGQLEVSFLDVGQGLSVFIRSPEGRTVLVDAGPSRGGYDSGERVVLPFLHRRGAGSIDLLILTHPHSDHYGGMGRVAGTVPVGLFASSGEKENSEPFEALLQLLTERGVQQTILAAGDRINLDGSTAISVLSPPGKKFRGTTEDTNNNSIVMKLEYNDFSLLLTGDAENDALSYLAGQKKPGLASTVLQVPHHGSRNAKTPVFLSAVGAEAGVISVGKNSFGHPHRDTLEMLEQFGYTVYRTDMHGCVTFYSNGRSWHAVTFINQPQMVIIRKPVLQVITQLRR